MAKRLEMDPRAEEIFRQLLGLTMDKPIPSQVHYMWSVAIGQQHRWMSGGPLPDHLMQLIALMHTLGVVTRYEVPEKEPDERPPAKKETKSGA